MRREELDELHYITPIVNVGSILARGILSHQLAKRVNHESVAMPEIQARRAKVKVPGAGLLHDYVNLYICSRNPMMYLRHDDHKSLCVLRISTNVLNIPEVVVADRNASSDYVRFGPAPDGLGMIDGERVFARYWTHADPIEQQYHKSVMCAEVLVPDRIDPNYVTGAYVSCHDSRAMLRMIAPNLPTTINPHLFFQ